MKKSPGLSATALSLTGIAPLVTAAALLPDLTNGLGAWTLLALGIAFVPAVFAAFTASRLHARFNDPSTAFRWGKEAFGPFGGFLGGSIVVVLSLFLIVSLLMNSLLWFNRVAYFQNFHYETPLNLFAGVFMIVAMLTITLLTARGFRFGSRILWVMLGIQLLVIAFVSWESATYRDPAAGLPNAGITAREAQLQTADQTLLYLVSDMSSLMQLLTASVLIFGGWMLAFSRRSDSDNKAPGYGSLLALVLNFLVMAAITVVPGSRWWGMDVSWIPAVGLMALSLLAVQSLMAMALDTLKAMTDDDLLPSKFASRPFGAWSILAFLVVSPFALDSSPSGGGQTIVLLLMLFALLSGAACLRLAYATGTRIVASASIVFSGVITVLMIHPSDYTTYALGFNSFPIIFLSLIGLLYISSRWMVDLEKKTSPQLTAV